MQPVQKTSSMIDIAEISIHNLEGWKAELTLDLGALITPRPGIERDRLVESPMPKPLRHQDTTC